MHGVELTPALIVEDDPVVRNRLRHLLMDASEAAPALMRVAGDVASAKRCLRDIESGFSLALIDIGLPDASGIELIGHIHAAYPITACVVVTGWSEQGTVLAALRAGAVGYLLKERDDEELVLALRSVQRGGAPIDPFVARYVLGQLSTADASDGQPSVLDDKALSTREVEVLHLVERGHSNREIAALTGLSRFTIEGYTKAIYRKLAVGSRTAAVHAARSRGLLE